ncbi:MAG TPA: ABC transporter substrate-binding protein [Actinomycetota bacterium]|nr:ABC transporter substrate-binding protein [Actinomycetota bacterium]
MTVALTNPDFLDPARASNRSAILVLKQICDTLTSFEPRTGLIKPAIAESWTIAPDAKKVTFKLRKGVKFHNGREVVAQDFVYSLSRFAHPKTGSSQHFFLDRVVGYPEFRAERTPTLPGLKAPDPITLEVELSEPFADLPAVLAHPAAGAPVPKEEVEKPGDVFAATPICTGPYSLSEPWTKDKDIKLNRFPDYYAANPSFAANGVGLVEKIVFKAVGDHGAAYKLLEENKAHVADVPLDRLSQAKRVKDRLESGSNGHLTYIGLPVSKPPFDNLAFRRALALSVDRKRIVEDLLAGSRKIPTSFLPPGSGRVTASDCGSVLGAKPRKAAATKALQDSKIDPAATNLSVYLNSGGGHEKWVGMVQDQWTQTLGVTSTVKPEEWKKYLDFLVDPGPDGPFRLAWAAKYPSPEAVLDPLFAPQSLDNFTRYKDPKFEELLKKARATVNDSARLAAYGDALGHLCREMPIIPMWFGQNHVGFATRVASTTDDRLDVFGDPILRELGFRSAS